jgi:two-component system, OmpR family, sensor histidine kinase KdpD
MKTPSLALGIRIFRYAVVTVAALLVVALYRRGLHVNQTTVALTFLVLVLVVATRWRLSYSVYLSFLCAALYNFFFLPPVGTFTIADPQNWITLSALLCASVLVSHLSESERRQAEVSEGRRREVERLYEFSQRLLLQEDMQSLHRLAPAIIAQVFHLRAVALYLRDENSAYYSDPNGELLPLEPVARAAASGDPVPSTIDGPRLVPLVLGMRSVGALAMTEGEYSEGIYEAVAGLLAIAMERASAVERSSHAEAARESERLRSALLDSVTHELRTPLTAIRAAITSLITQPSLADAERHEMYSVVDEESTRLNALIGQVVEMAQLDSANIQIHSTQENLGEVIDLAVEDCHALLRRRQIVRRISDDLPAVFMDRELVKRVLRHLIENAAKYSPPESPITVSAEVDTDNLVVSVTDHGPGIEEAEQSLIFDKFYRGGRQRHRVQGTGMGLAIVQAILRSLGGGIRVVSRPGEGATFTFWLPLRQPAKQ